MSTWRLIVTVSAKFTVENTQQNITHFHAATELIKDDISDEYSVLPEVASLSCLNQ